jgi:plasmid stabilization system protein ParE
MNVGYHPAVQGDLNRAQRRYDQESSRLGDDFSDKLTSFIQDIAANPMRFHLYAKDLRRANLKRFPYHILYRILPDRVRVIALRHHRQHPSFGLQRR